METANALRGALAGAIGGIVGGALKLACEAVVPPRPPGREPPPGVLVADLVRNADGRELTADQKERAASTIHWIFSTLSGAALGAAVESLPALERTEGLVLGVALWAGLHEIFLPLARATPPLPDLPLSEQINEFVTHCAYGFAVERTRRSLRPLFDPF